MLLGLSAERHDRDQHPDYRKGEITMIDAKQSFLSQVRKRAAEELTAAERDLRRAEGGHGRPAGGTGYPGGRRAGRINDAISEVEI